ncbi:MAG: EAL domain-containing protein [Actinobacteria bacterium]|nr:EAL domain-containing protein [Actinomycetota bacterium]
MSTNGAADRVKERKLRLPFPSSSGEQRVWLLSALFAVSGVAIYFLHSINVPSHQGSFHIPWWILAPGFALAEVAVAHLQLRKEVVSASLVEIPMILGLFFSTPSELTLALMLGVTFAFAVVRKQPLLKMSFNLAKYMLEVGIAIAVFHFVVGMSAPMEARGWLGTFSTTLMSDIFSGLAVYAAICMAQGKREGLPEVVGFGTIASLANACVALLAATILWSSPKSGWLLLFPAILLVFAYRAYTNQRENHHSMEKLFESAKVLQRSVDTETVVSAMLSQARQMVLADYAEYILFEKEGSHALFSSQGPGDESLSLRPLEMDPSEGLWARIAAEGQPVLLSRPIKNERLGKHFAARGIHDAIAVPIYGADGADVVGQLLVGNHLGDVRTFEEGDLKLLETLATHASVALEKGALIDSLASQAAENEFQAQHDALTGLYNRAFFHDRVMSSIEETGADGMLAVLLMDLDRFKEINDTLGHHIGDSLLVEMAARLSKSMPHEATVARLGGDEFAILLPNIDGLASATSAADELVVRMTTPFDLEQLTLDVDGSIGIALYPVHGVDADTLMQRADVAMYLAKENHRGYEIYASDRDQYSPSRLALVAELRAAVDADELEVWYQPKVDLLTRKVLGAEALVRWNHPRNGMMPPDEFVSLAEHTGLIGPMTELVLDHALERCRHLRRAGRDDFKVAVNLSVRNLMDSALPTLVSKLLLKWNLPADAVQLEITESTIMADPVRAITTLSALKRMGIALSIDDFGTGYSSLAYLKRLPVAEVKIDRSFVMGMTTDENDTVIVRSVIDLARNLGLEVVAEGIETQEAWDHLVALGCQIGQGYYVSRPLPGPEFDQWLEDNAVDAGSARPSRADGVVPLVPRRTASGWAR